MTTNDPDQGAMPSSEEPQTRREYPDTLSQKGALALAKRLQDYWHGLGHTDVRFWTEPVAERFAKIGTYEIYRIVCNLVDGLPPRYR